MPRMGGRCFLMRWVTFHLNYSLNFCVFCKSNILNVWGAPERRI